VRNVVSPVHFPCSAYTITNHLVPVSNDHLDELFGIQDKVTIIIGATGELGGAIAKGLRQAGAHVVLVGRNEATGTERAETLSDVADAGSARFISCDTTSKRQLKDLRERVDDHFGRLDVLVNSAGVNSDTPFLEIDEEEWNHIMEVNLKGVFLSCQVFGRYLIDQGEGGSIINISSMAGMTPLSRVFTYSASKAGLINLSKNLAREWAPHDICVNCIAPGFFPAEQNREILSEERIANIRDHTPMDRFGEANELIGTMLLLASDEASSFITGTNIPVDGGFSAMTV